MGVIRRRALYHLLRAAYEFGETRDPASAINRYLIANRQLTANIRADSGQPDAWRDYQQILSELGLIVSTRVSRSIVLTPLALSYLDGSLSFSDLMSLQALRYQYPNGHKVDVSSTHRELLAHSGFASRQSLAELQAGAGIQLRPGLLIWRVLRLLDAAEEVPQLSAREIATYLMRCARHSDAEAAVEWIIRMRGGNSSLDGADRRRTRNAQDWIRFLNYTPVFDRVALESGSIRISNLGNQHAHEMDQVYEYLVAPARFWRPGDLDNQDKVGWYAFFGTIDPMLPLKADVSTAENAVSDDEYPGGREPVADLLTSDARTPTEINLREFRLDEVRTRLQPVGAAGTIQSSYSSSLTTEMTRLHDLMVVHIARHCLSRGASVLHDPTTVDLLVDHGGTEFIVEVKSVTSKNIVSRLRYGIGQLLHYDYLRSRQSDRPRRKVIGFAASIDSQSWYPGFLNDHLDIDLLSLDRSRLKLFSSVSEAQLLFG